MIRDLIRKYRTQLGDSVWSISGLVLMSAVAQIVVFPFLAARLGECDYGDLQYLMAYINIVTVSIGCAANMARMTMPAERRLGHNGDYHVLLIAVCLFGIPLTQLIRSFGGVAMDMPTAVSYYFLFVAMAFRYYADVSYKLTLRYRRYFTYYLVISLGYVLGALLFHKTGIWPLALLPGEAAGVIYAYVRDDTLRRGAFRLSPVFGTVAKAVMIFFFSEGVSNLILNADRLILKFMIGSAAVTVYYLATLVGKIISLVTIPLNGVLLGYLARYEGKLTKRAMRWLILGSLISFGVFTGVCVFGGWLMLIWLYPGEYNAVRPFLLVGGLAQVIYFTTSIVSVVLVRFANKSYQIYINGAFALCFFGAGVPAILGFGLWGFAIAVIAANLLRWIVAVALGCYWVAKGCEKWENKIKIKNSRKYYA